MSDEVMAWTDGSCLRNPGGPGGWAVVLEVAGHDLEIFGNSGSTTNNRMEMMAVYRAILAVPKSVLIVHTDSSYVADGINEWRHGWKENGWKRKSRSGKLHALNNSDLWEAIDHALENRPDNREVVIRKVRGHNGIPQNERADTLAKREARRRGRIEA